MTECLGVISLNGRFLISPTGFLMTIETILGIAIFSLLMHFSPIAGFFGSSRHTFLLLVSFGYFVITFLMLICCVVSETTAETLPKTLFELMYNALGVLLLLSAGIASVTKYYEHEKGANERITAGALAILNTIAYFFSAYFSAKSFMRGEISVVVTRRGTWIRRGASITRQSASTGNERERASRAYNTSI